MPSSTSLISGLASGLDWSGIVDKLIEVERKRVTVVSAKKTEYEKKLAQWQSLNTKLLALKTAVGKLKDPDDFNLFTASLTTDRAAVKAADLLSAAASSTAAPGSYNLKVNAVATAQKLSSRSFSSSATALGNDYAGDMVINGVVVTVTAEDTLATLRDKINNANTGANPTGVTAGIVNYGSGDYRLILTSDATGAAGISLKNGGAADLLGGLGFWDTSRTAKNPLAGGDRTDRFTSTTVAIGSLLGLSNPQAAASGEIVVNGHALGGIDLATDTLDSLLTKFTTAGVAAKITTEEEGGRTYYRLLVEGSANTYTDKNNILETLGLLTGGLSDVLGVTGDVANTASGQVITATTFLKDIDGYTGWAGTDYLLIEGTDTSGNPVSDNTFAIGDTTTVGDLLTRIESLFGTVTASVTGDGKIRVIADTPGATSLAVKISVKDAGGETDTTLRFDADGDLGTAGVVRKRELVTGADASVTVDGVTVTRSTNTIDDVITGVTLNLLKADTDTTVTLKVGRDIDAVVSLVSGFVSAYNDVAAFIKTQTSYDAEKQQAGGVLFGDGTLMSIKTDLTSILVRNLWNASSRFSILGTVGVSVDINGQLSVNEATLRSSLNTYFTDVQRLFGASGLTSTGSLEYVSHGRDTKEGTYGVTITQAAARSTSAPSDAVSLGGDEVLTITSGSAQARVELQSGMTMERIVNAVNSELAKVYTQTLAGSERLYADASQTTTLQESTVWSSVYDDVGQSANLQDNDVITFTGTKRNGASVSGSYTIGDADTDTVAGLLSAIEEAFGNEVTADIDSSGRIIVTDRTAGASSLSLSLDFSQAHDLDFGSLSPDNDGGTRGRYAMGVTAYEDEGGHLVLYHNTYGSAYTFTIHQDNNLLWTGGDQTVDNGKDVAGTINGEAATGTGQVLKGDEGQPNVAGLSLRYTGTATGDIGTVTLTYGVAELFDRALYAITDTYDGYLTLKQQSLEDLVTDYDRRISDMEERLAKRKEEMLNRYVKMELALQKVQNQSTWLTGQINALSRMWGD